MNTRERAVTGGLASDDERTHTERINPGENPAHIPGISLGPPFTTDRKPYRLKRAAKHADVILPRGTIVMLTDEEVQDHHEEAPDHPMHGVKYQR
jgi:hypothetical protein